MRRNLVHEGADQLRYEIREIVDTAHSLAALGRPVIWENIGDPIQKGEPVPEWIREIVTGLASANESYAYTATAGSAPTRKFLSAIVNGRGGAQITENDILFFNGLGDAISTIFSQLRREARVLGPSPAYSTLSSAEAAHSGYAHTTYRLDPDNHWLPDIEDLRQKVKYNDSIAGILMINPDNPTGAVYPREILEQIVAIAREYDLFLICDETYAHIVYGGGKTCHLSEVIGTVPGIALRSISKEFPWPGGRCGWIEIFNQDKDPNFAAFIKSLLDAKRLEVCSTSLPQMVIPRVFADPRYREHLDRRNRQFELRAREAVEALGGIPGVKVNEPQGALYLTVLFEKGTINNRQTLPIDIPAVQTKVEALVRDVAADKRFVLYLLGATGICVVPLSGFCTTLEGFRMTLLEHNDETRRDILKKVSWGIRTWLAS
jgi:aspartate/methionine/tyrosine aminotransferase